MPKEEKIEILPIDQILEPLEQVRKTLDEEKLENLSRSIKLVGQIEPIKVKKEGEKYRIIDGQMRYLAIKMIGGQTIKAIVRNTTEEIESALRVHANIFRIPQDPLGEAEYFQRLMVDWGINASQLAERLRLPISRIRDRLAILNYPPEIIKAIENQQVGLGVARQLARLENEFLRKDFLKRAIRDGLSENMAKTWVDKYSGIKPEEPPPPPEKIEKELKELEIYYSDPCEICGGKIKKSEWGTLEGHLSCLSDVREAARQYVQTKPKSEKPKPEEKPEVGK